MRLSSTPLLFFAAWLGACSTGSSSKNSRVWINQPGWTLEEFYVNNSDQVLREAGEKIVERAYFESVSPVLTLGGATLDSWTPEGFWILNQADWGEWWMDLATIAWHDKILNPTTAWLTYIDTYKRGLDITTHPRTFILRNPVRTFNPSRPETTSPPREFRGPLEWNKGDTTQISSIKRRLKWPEPLQRRRRGSLGACRSIESALPFYRFDPLVPLNCLEIPGPESQVSLTWRGTPIAGSSRSFDAATFISALAQIHRQQWRPDETQIVKALLNTNPGFRVDFETWLEKSFEDMQKAYQSTLLRP